MLQTLSFNGARPINAAATFFRYESGTAGGADEAIRVRADGNDLGLYYPGDSVELPMQATMWEITPVTPTTAGLVRLGVGRVQSARLSGTVRVLDEVTDSILSAVIGGTTALTTFSVAQMVAPAANAAGMILRMASCGGVAGAGGVMKCRIMAAKAAPTAYFNPSQCYQLVEHFTSSTGETGTTVRINKRLPPGWGVYLIWEITGAVTASNPSGVVQYELQ